MVLPPHERAKFVISLVAARYLDISTLKSDEINHIDKISAARNDAIYYANKIFYVAGSQELILFNLDQLISTLNQYDKNIEGICAAANLIRSYRQIIIERQQPPKSLYAFQDSHIAAIPITATDEKIRDLLINRLHTPSVLMPEIEYFLQFIDISPPYNIGVNGIASIAVLPRSVSLMIPNNNTLLTAAELCHFYYTIYHELICHAFQCLGSSYATNAEPECSWTEGFMDKIAFDLLHEAITLQDESVSWISLSVDDAVGTLYAFHNARYQTNVYLEEIDLKRRQWMRDTCTMLAAIFLRTCIAKSPNDANSLSRDFALAVNLHSDALPERLQRFASSLRITVLNTSRPIVQLKTAFACLTFTRNRDFEKLESELCRMIYNAK